MMSQEKVLDVGYCRERRCVTIEYEADGIRIQAAVAEKLAPKVGDTVWVLRNPSKLDYNGFCTVAVLIA